MTNLSKGETWYDPQTDSEFTVQENVDTFGMDTHELDRLSVKVRFEDGETLSVPHERFRGSRSYERVNQ